MIKHIKKWWYWQKYNRNNFFYKILVLFRIVGSPIFFDQEAFHDAFMKGLDSFKGDAEQKMKESEKKRMTNEEAIVILDCERPYGNSGCGATEEEIEEALNMAIKALGKESCDDCISRAEAVKAMAELEQDDIKTYGCSIPEGFDGKRAIRALCALKSVKPK